MATLEYSHYAGYGEMAKKDYHYSQAVRVGDRIEISGQGGWDPSTGECHDTLQAQIEQAFSNVELTLKTAGSKGWDDVFRLTSYHVGLDDEAVHCMVATLKKWTPHHEPIWSCLGVEKLALPGMKVEIEVVAFNPK